MRLNLQRYNQINLKFGYIQVKLQFKIQLLTHVKCDKEKLGMANQQNQQSNPHIEPNDDKGKKDSNQNSEPQKKPNEQPENPLKEQK